MGVYIKDMEMPEGCFSCILSFMWFNGTETVLQCNVLNKLVSDDGSKDPDCHLTEIPPHGRLIDADALEVQDGWLRDSKYFAQESSHTHISFVYSNDIDNAPTVIPADKEGEKNG